MRARIFRSALNLRGTMALLVSSFCFSASKQSKYHALTATAVSLGCHEESADAGWGKRSRGSAVALKRCHEDPDESKRQMLYNHVKSRHVKITTSFFSLLGCFFNC